MSEEQQLLSDAHKEEVQAMAASAFFHSKGLLAHQFESFDRFCDTGLAPLLCCEAEQEITLDEQQIGIAKLSISNLGLGRPQVEEADQAEDEHQAARPLLPAEARLRNMSYSAPIHANVELKLFSCPKEDQIIIPSLLKEVSLNDVRIGELPVMVKSKLCHLHASSRPELNDCPFDSGGYFIIKGVEKILIPQEEGCIQLTRVWDRKTMKASFGTPSDGFANRSDVCYTPDGHFTLIVPSVHPIPIAIAFRALGVSTDKQLLELMTHNIQQPELTELVWPSLADAQNKLAEFFKTRKCGIDASRKTELALEFIGSCMKTRNQHTSSPAEVLEKRLFPGLGPGNTRKAILLGYMVRCVCQCLLGWRTIDDMDSFKNKRLLLAGDLISAQLKQLKFHFVRDVFRRLQKHVEAGKETTLADTVIFDKSLIASGLLRAFSTGNWPHKGKSVVATLKRDNPMLTLSQLRLITNNMTFTGNAGNAKLPNSSHYGRVCLVETPDDDKCGLTKALAIFAMVSASVPEEDILEKLWDCQMQSLEDIALVDLHRWGKIFLNGKWVGVTDNPDALITTMRRLRREGLISPQTELARICSENEIRISTDGGRLLRPLLVVEKQQPLLFTKEHKFELKQLSRDLRFTYMLQRGLIDLLGPEEEENAAIALSEKELLSTTDFQFTHMELHPASLLGLGAIGIPFLNHNHCSRVTHQAQKHGKQAIGFYCCNLRGRMDTSSHKLFYPQRPLLRPQTMNFFGNKEELANGANCVVAVACYTGYNQEDSLILNQSSLDRGLFRSTHYRVYKDSLPARADQQFAKPGGESARQNSTSVEKLEDDGLPRVETFLTARDAVIGKVSTKPTSKFSDHSLKLKPMENPGAVDQVVYSTSLEGDRNVKVRLREMRVPEIGDKFSSMHGQKGVVGMTFRQEDLFFTHQGIVPDVIINPHAFPTRQTLAQLLESVLGKAAACEPSHRNQATPFAHPRVEDVTELLHRCEFQRWGQERVYSGRTGKSLEALTTIGITFYQRLTHMSMDKMKWRGRNGPVHPLTLQPVKDRNRHGGMKFGEMERDCLIAHGASAAVQERLFVLSDKSQVHVCAACNRIVAAASARSTAPFCSYCNSKHKIVLLEIPHACKLLHMELSAMSVDMRFKVDQL